MLLTNRILLCISCAIGLAAWMIRIGLDDVQYQGPEQEDKVYCFAS